MSEKDFYVTYTSRDIVLIRAKDAEAAEKRAMAVLTGGVMMSPKRGVVIEKVESE